MYIKPFNWPQCTEFKKRSVTNYIVIHHSVSSDVSAEIIHGWHLQKGYKGIGYNYVIRVNGDVEEGRPHWAEGAHVYGKNDVSVGICLAGDFEKHKPTSQQINVLVELCRNLLTVYKDAVIVRHEDLAVTECPGKYFPWEEFLNNVRKDDFNMGAFKDVKNDMWYAGAVEFCNQKGIMGGYTDGTFKPNQPVTRAEIASLASRLYMLTSEQERAQKVWNDCAESVVVVRAKGGGGSGFFINNDTIVTNAHVVNGLNQVTISTKNNGDFIGEVQRRGAIWDDKGIPQAIGSSLLVDLATVKLTKKANEKAVWGNGFKPVKFANKVPVEMSFLVIIGNPLLIEFWGSYGVVSRLTNYYIDTDAAINPGNSGGAAFNLNGEFVGVPTQKYTGAEIDNMGNIIRFDAVKLWLEGKTDEIKF